MVWPRTTAVAGPSLGARVDSVHAPPHPPVKHAVPSARRRVPQGVQLAWARDRDGRKVRASRLAPADRRGRAPFTCLGCGEELIPHLGRIRTPHFAHRAGSTCPLTAPETALHLDAKERLLCALRQDAFAGPAPRPRLARCPECRRVAPVDVAAPATPPRRRARSARSEPTCCVRAGERPVLAFEVRVTHAVEPEKEAALGDGRGAGGGGGRPRGVGAGGGRRGRHRLRPEPRVRPVRRLPHARRAEAVDREGRRGGRDRRAGGVPREGAAEAVPPSGPARPSTSRPEAPDAPLTPAELAGLGASFSCPDCGGPIAGGREPDSSATPAPPAPRSSGRPVAWRGYDGSLVTLGWWQSGWQGGPDRPPAAAENSRHIRHLFGPRNPAHAKPCPGPLRCVR